MRNAKAKRHAALALALVLFLIGLVAAWSLLPLADWALALKDSITSLGAWGVIVFALLYVAVVLALLPVAPFTVAAGMIYGWWALPFALASATLAAALAFAIARHLARDPVRKLIERHQRLKAVDRAVVEEGWKIVGLLRLSPFPPFALQSYVFGVTSIGFVPFVAATFLGIIPGGVLYVYLGQLGQAAASGTAGPLQWTFSAVGLAAILIGAAVIMRKAREKLRESGVEP